MVTARVFAGISFEDNRYSGTIVLPSDHFEQLLDCLIFGAAQVGACNENRLRVYFTPDAGDDE